MLYSGNRNHIRKPSERIRRIRVKLLNALKKIVGAISVLIFLSDTCCVLTQIISRNLTGRSYATIEEFVVISLPYFGMFAATYTMYLGNHVQIELLYNKMPKPVRRALYILTQIAMIVALVLLMRSSWKMAMKQWKIKTPAIGWPNGTKYLCFVSACPFMIPLFLHNIYRALHKDFDETYGLAEVRKSAGGQ